MVKRAVNNAVALRMGLDRFLQIRRDVRQGSSDIYGNTLEALIGAIFLDRGYLRAEAFVLERVLPLFLELERSLMDQTMNYKSLLLEWTQKHRLSLDFRMLQEPKRSGVPFVCGVFVDDKRIGLGRGLNKALLALCRADEAVARELGINPALLESSQS